MISLWCFQLKSDPLVEPREIPSCSVRSVLSVVYTLGEVSPVVHLEKRVHCSFILIYSNAVIHGLASFSFSQSLVLVQAPPHLLIELLVCERKRGVCAVRCQSL